mmetsp:Transcript_19608/g.28646  ORF Transcript_19608/g.28646 Transcript_19608/m.28646 type:complete len:86 (+) Transcript_19608:404-661(+)
MLYDVGFGVACHAAGCVSPYHREKCLFRVKIIVPRWINEPNTFQDVHAFISMYPGCINCTSFVLVPHADPHWLSPGDQGRKARFD